VIKSHRSALGIAAAAGVLLVTAFLLVQVLVRTDSLAAPKPDPTASAVSTAASARVASWRLISTSPDGTELTLGVALGGTCERLDTVHVQESTSSVTITPIVRTGLADACTDSLSLVQSTVDLANPLGARTLVHGDEFQ
jgi:hypothetical protein